MKSEHKIIDLESQIIALLRSLDEIKKMNSLGKTKQIADEIEKILHFYNQ
jgi:hypothetical protein